MSRKSILLFVFVFLVSFASTQAQAPLRVFIRAGEKTHGPNQHDHPRFLAEGKDLLNQRGAKADGAMNFPTDEQLQNTDVLVLFAAEAGTMSPEQRASLEKFLKRGGGIVAIHDAVCGTDAPWFKTIIGGAWEHGHSKWFEGKIAMYFQDHLHPITKGISNFDLDDEMYYDLHMMSEAHVLAATYAPDKRNTHDGKMYPSVYEIVPQIWTYENKLDGGQPYRAFVSIPGHNYSTFELPHYRALLLRGIAWAGKRDIDSLCFKEELASLRYPEGGPTAPENAADQIVVHPDFKINLVASEPLIDKPISLDWDPSGRMWIAETPEYPNGRKDPTSRDGAKEDRPARDRISILEDSDGDGVMDKKSIFYEGLELVTSFVFYKDGVIVSQAPDVYWLRDTDSDGKADKKITLFTGFGTGDAHAVLSNLRWGMDGWIYATVGYSRGDVYSGDGQTHFGKISDGVFRFKPDGSAIEQISSKGGNTWGVDQAPDGEIFFSQANGNHINHVVMPESALARGKIGNTTSYKTIEDHKASLPIRDYEKQAYVQIDWVGGFTAAAGACIYNGGAWPERYNGTFFVTEPTVNLVHEDFLKPDGVTYIASRDPERSDKEFIASTDLWFRPIHVRVGPDGALYILDFYNQAVVHNDTRGTPHGANNAAVRPDRDHYFGRIWRVQHKDAKKFEIPNLAKASPQELIKALEHPNGWVRNTAQRLLIEDSEIQTPNVTPTRLQNLASNPQAPENSRVLAYWTLSQLEGGLSDNFMKLASKGLANEKSSAVRKNIAQICSAYQPMWSEGGIRAGANFPVAKSLNDSDPRAQLEFLQALANMNWEGNPEIDLSQLHQTFNDAWRKSALVGIAIASKNPEFFLYQILQKPAQSESKEFVQALAQKISYWPSKGIVSSILTISEAPVTADSLKQIALETFTQNVSSEKSPGWSSALQNAFHTLLASTNPGVVAATLPLIAHWDKNGAMAAEVKTLLPKLFSSLTDASQPDDQREQAMKSLLSLRSANPEILPAVAKILGSHSSIPLQQQVIESLGALNDNSVGATLVEAYPRVAPELQEPIFAQIIRRSDWSLALANAIDSGKINFGSLSPNSIHRLRTHGDAKVANRANQVFEKLRGPEVKEKNALIEKFTPVVMQPGNVENGHKLFTANCAVCHKFQGEGKEVAPDLTGMGVHGPAELLVHVLDPNRVVEPNFIAYSIETTDDQSLDGILASENKREIVLRNATGDFPIERKNIKSQRSTGRSLMPEGFEALGGDGLRDVLGYLCAGENRFRVIDLKKAFSADTTRGIFNSPDATDETLSFKKFGIVKVGDVPFEIISSTKTASGKNVIELKGGNGFAKTMPQKVEISDVNLRANTLHFLGGVGGWAFPWNNEAQKNIPVAKLTISFADGATEEMVMKNGEEFADYIGHQDVPGSKEVPGLLNHGQVRSFSKPIQHAGLIQKMTLESLDNAVAPVFVAITAEVGEPKVAQASSLPDSEAQKSPTTSPAKFIWGKHPRVLIVGGNASHDFEKWFHQADMTTLNEIGSANYTEDLSRVQPALPDIDVLYLANNQPMTDDALNKAIFDFADSGGPLLLVHPALWYNWKNWPEYNRVFVGGGSRGHEKYGEFEVTVDEPNHPIMAGVQKTFRLSDELYRHEPDTNGSSIEVLATGKSLVTDKTYPVVWITQHPKTKIVCITLGHDGSAHDGAAYKTILQNCVKWLAGK